MLAAPPAWASGGEGDGHAVIGDIALCDALGPTREEARASLARALQLVEEEAG